MMEWHTFLDALKFLGKTHYELAKITPRDKLRESSKYFAGNKLDLLTKKRIYPFDYIDLIEKNER